MGEENAAAQGKPHQGVCEVIAPDDLECYFHLIILNKWFRLKTRAVLSLQEGWWGNGLRLVSQVSELAPSASLEVQSPSFGVLLSLVMVQGLLPWTGQLSG